jgi:hypothetical protein
VLATASYLGVMRRCVEAAGESEREDPHWRPTWAGRLLAWSMTSQRRFPAPRGWRPPDVPRPHVREAWAGELRELVALLDRAAVLPWNRLRFRSPAAPLIRLNLGDGFHIVVLHAERHSGQIDRALALSPSDGASTG